MSWLTQLLTVTVFETEKPLGVNHAPLDCWGITWQNFGNCVITCNIKSFQQTKLDISGPKQSTTKKDAEKSKARLSWPCQKFAKKIKKLGPLFMVHKILSWLSMPALCTSSSQLAVGRTSAKIVPRFPQKACDWFYSIFLHIWMLKDSQNSTVWRAHFICCFRMSYGLLPLVIALRSTQFNAQVD